LRRRGADQGDDCRRKVEGVRQAITAAGAARLYLPPYSLDLNSIEQLFLRLKAHGCKAAACTEGELWQGVVRRPPNAPTASTLAGMLLHIT
jgi:transposase